MANLTNRYGSSLLALNTLRPPDRVRGETLVHLELKLPAAITAQVDLWEKGSRGPLDPREAASLLWTTPVARFLDGRVDAWRDVPGIDILLPGLEKLASTDQKTWPKDQAALQTLVAATAPNSPQWAAVSKNLTNAGAADFLNDLVLIFKYAAVNRERPVRTVAELYRLIRALMEKDKPPKTVKEVIAWLTSPLVIPRPLTTPSGAGGPRVPPPPPASPPAPPHPRFDLTSPRAASALDRLSAELSNLEASGRAAKLHSALRSAGVTDPVVLRRITRDALEPTPGRGGDASPGTVREFTIGQPLRAASSEKPQIIRTQLYGSPVLIDVSEALKRTEMLRKEMAFRLVEVLPAS